MDKKHKLFLDNLKDSGVTNMFGAVPYLIKEFGIDKREAKNILQQWMQNFE